MALVIAPTLLAARRWRKLSGEGPKPAASGLLFIAYSNLVERFFSGEELREDTSPPGAEHGRCRVGSSLVCFASWPSFS
jgi:hypothetical protein